jgi:hypothetical protein
VIEGSITVNDVCFDRIGGWLIQVQLANIKIGVPRTQDGEILLARLGDDDRTTSIQEEARVIADTGADL